VDGGDLPWLTAAKGTPRARKGHAKGTEGALHVSFGVHVPGVRLGLQVENLILGTAGTAVRPVLRLPGGGPGGDHLVADELRARLPQTRDAVVLSGVSRVDGPGAPPARAASVGARVAQRGVSATG
jgi:hypothetical protein